jgi:hypothetical protein
MNFWTELAFIMATTSRWRWCRRFRTSREGVPAVSERVDGWREGGGDGRDAAVASRYTRNSKSTAASIMALVIDSSAQLGHRTNPFGPDPSMPMERQFYSTTRNCFGCIRFGHTRTAPDGSQIFKWDPLEGNGQGRAAARSGPARNLSGGGDAQGWAAEVHPYVD